eukprot:765641-Pleurochrysis_carterae.AAC.1
MSKTCLYGHSPNQSLVAHVGSATDSDHNLYAAVVCKVLSNVYDHGQIKGPVPKSSRPMNVLGCVRCTQKCYLGCVASLYATNTDLQCVGSVQH